MFGLHFQPGLQLFGENGDQPQAQCGGGREIEADRQPDAVEYVRNTAATFGIDTYVMTISGTSTKASYTQLRRGLYAGATLTMVLIGASLLVTILEQLQDRKKLLAVLVAFGTRRSALASGRPACSLTRVRRSSARTRAWSSAKPNGLVR